MSAAKKMRNRSTKTLKGKVERLFYSSPGWSAGKLIAADGSSVSFAGNLMVQPGDQVILTGAWTQDPKYGLQFKVAGFEFDQNLSADGLAHYLANNPAMKGIGPAKAHLIAQAFADNFDHVIEHEPERIAQVAKVPVEVALALKEEWLRTRSVNAAMTWLGQFGLTHLQVTRLVERFGSSVVTVLKKDPYLLMREIDRFGFRRVDEIAAKIGVPRSDRGRIRAGLVHCVLERLDSGNCWVGFEDLIEEANKLLTIDLPESRSIIEAELNAAISEKELACESIGGRFLVALPSILGMERDLAAVLDQGANANPHLAFLAGSEELEKLLPPELNEGQRRAIDAAVKHRLVVISGSAGVGKSFVMGALVRIAESQGLKVALAAPTGKAAKRLEQATGRPASTLHRLLGYNGDDFADDPEDLQGVQLLIVDEVSMVDVPLAWNLFLRLDLEKTAVVLVGDHNQLPPVGPGNLLRDLIDRRPVPTVVLDQVMRQAGVLRENSLAVLKGQVRPTAAQDEAGHFPWIRSVPADCTVEGIRAFIIDLFQTKLTEKLGFDLLEDVQLLTPQRKGPLGVEELNKLLQRTVQKKLWGVEVEPVPPNRRPSFLSNDRVIQMRNNYELNVMNGSLGRIVDIGAKGKELAVKFDDGVRCYTAESGAARDLELAYANTIHKCVHPDTLVETPEGLLPIRALHRGGGIVAAPGGARDYDSFVENPAGELLEFETRDGYRLTVTPEHGIDVWTDRGFARVEARDIAPSALLRLKLGITCDPENPPDLPAPEPAAPGAPRFRYPRTVTPEFAEFLGLMVADGRMSDAGFRVVKRRRDARNRFAKLCKALFGATVSRFKVGRAYGAEVRSAEIVGWLRRVGGMEPSKAEVPGCILRSPAELHAAFLRGLFEDEAGKRVPTSMLQRIDWTTTNPALEQTVRTMLLRLGVMTEAKRERPGCIFVYGQSVRRFVEKTRIEATFGPGRGQYDDDSGHYKIPLTNDEARSVCAAIVTMEGIDPHMTEMVMKWGAILRRDAHDLVERASESSKGADTPVIKLLRERIGFHYSSVRQMRRLTGPSMCINVPDEHQFLQNGFAAWNSQGSEFPCAIVIAHKAHSFMAHRNLLYTAVTRARKTVILVGDLWGMRHCAEKEEVDRRKTFLSVLELSNSHVSELE
jgi:exodeoxyribonuclease V alpha subunit